MLQETTQTDAFGNATTEQFNNNAIKTTRTFDAGMGRLQTIATGPSATPKSVQDLEVRWRSNSTVLQRIDHKNTTSTTDDAIDAFSYDAMERVTQQATTGGASRTLDFGYDNITGNLTSKLSNVTNDMNVTAYGYTISGKPHQLKTVEIGGIGNTLSYAANGNTTQYIAGITPPSLDRWVRRARWK